MYSGLELTLLLLGSAVLGVVAFRMLHLPPMLGYLAVGILIGPHALGLADNNHTTHTLAEFGVVFLMFSIGLEFSLSQLNAMRRVVFGLGMAQVVLTIVATMVFGVLLAWQLPAHIKITWQASFALGGALAMSSTAIVVKMLTERLELESPHGRKIIGILLFQDLAVVPLLILIPSLGKPPGELANTLAWASFKAVIVLVLLLYVGQKIMRKWFTIVVKRRSQELFMLNLLLITLGAAWITERAGLSLALGAFVAGMLISETQYKHQVEEDIKPFRDVLLGLFFITVGMLLNVGMVIENWWLVLILLVGPVLLKFAIIAGLAKLFGASDGTAMRTGLGLAQAGEFGFVLLTLTSDAKLIDDFIIQLVLASMVLSMLVAPFMIEHADKVVMKLSANEWMMQSLQLTQIATRTMATQKHVIIAGFGRSGQSLATLLSEEKVAYQALDLDPERVQEAQAAGGPCVVWRRGAQGSPDRGRRLPRQRAGDHLCQHGVGAQGAAPGARAGAHPARHRAQPRRHRPGPAEKGRRRRSGAGSAGRLADAGLARAGDAGRAAAARGAPRAKRARRTLRGPARLLPRCGRRPGRSGAHVRAPAFGHPARRRRFGRQAARSAGTA